MSSSSSSSATKQRGSPPLPTNSRQFSFACRCLNVRIDGSVPQDQVIEKSNGKGKEHRLWMGERAETVRLPAYVTWDQDDFRESRHKPKSPLSGDNTGLRACWRKCWLCETRLYFAGDKVKTAPAAQEEWVTIDPSSGILWGEELDTLDDSEDLLPFSSLALTLPSSSSNLGRPPQNANPSPYPSRRGLPDLYSDPDFIPRLLPPIPDPFFLPPPFIPSHPHLDDLCKQASGHLHAEHGRLEREIKDYIALKSKELKDLEDKVRAEVDMLWEKYRAGPGRGEIVDQKRALSNSGPPPSLGERRRSKTESKRSLRQSTSTRNNPILAEAAADPPYSNGSLLSASLSANPYYAPAEPASPPEPVADEVEDELSTITKTYQTPSDAQSMAMSLVFSGLDQAMADRKKEQHEQKLRSMRSRSQELRKIDDPEQNDVQADASEIDPNKDSWIEAENKMMQEEQQRQEEVEGPMGNESKSNLSRSKSKGKEKAVKFKDTAQEPIPNGGPGQVAEIQADPVFEFEMDESKAPDEDEPVSRTPPPDPRTAYSTRHLVEANLSRTFAAEAPSHRAAWRQHEPSSSLVVPTRRDQYDSDGEEMDESSISQLATSMPMAIMKLKPAPRDLPAMQRKTSLSDRDGVMVPPLLVAMRERGVNSIHVVVSSPRVGRSAQAQSSSGRSSSISRERERTRDKAYRGDPGPVFESLGDGSDSDDDDGDLEEEGGTLRESRTFVPPHVLARKDEQKDRPEVGWRSLVQS